MTVDSNARRQAILYEVAAVATRYTQDTPPGDAETRSNDLARAARMIADATHRHTPSSPQPALRELLGMGVAWLEHLAEQEAKA